MSPTKRGAAAITYAVPAAVAAGWWIAIGGWHTLNPANTWWMLDGDWLGFLYSWLFYRNAPWGLPLGQVPDLIYPYGATLALTDSLPLPATVMKLFSPLLPSQFQFYGLWMCSGFVGLSIVGVRVAARVTEDRVAQVLAGCLLAISPILTPRYGHPPFYALWALFGLIGLSLVPATRGWRDQVVAWALLFFTCSTNAYLAVMALGVAYAFAIRALISRSLTGVRATLIALIVPAAIAAVAFALFGYIASAGKVQGEGEGFGQFSADLLTLVNPGGWSRFFGGIATGHRQYEGYAYLGLGNLFLLIVGVVWLFRARPSRLRLLGTAPVLLVALGCAIFALSNVVTLRGQMVLDLRPAYAKLGSLPSIFRSSGRFIWPLHGLIVLSAIVAAVHLGTRRRWIGRAALGLALMLQVSDINVSASTLRQERTKFVPFTSAVWKRVGQDYRHLAIIPVQICWISPYDYELIGKLYWEAYSQRMSVNSGCIGRAPVGLAWDKHPGPGDLDPQTVYVVYFREYLPDFEAQGWACGPLDGLIVCVDPSRRTALLEALEANRLAGQTGVLRALH